MKSNTIAAKVVCCFSIISFLANSLFPASLHASEIFLPAPTEFVNLSSAFSFPVLKGLRFDPAEPLTMKFIIDTGSQATVTQEEAAKLIRYFFAGLSMPEKDIWVNLSPYEKDKVINDNLASTDLGEGLLSQDYILKQITASLTYPEGEVGKDFWSRAYTEVVKIAKTTNVPVNTFNKIWIIPDKAQVYENQGSAFVTEASLKAMLEEDYLSLKNNVSSIQNERKGMQEALISEINKATSGVMRSFIVPKINQDINSGKNFSTLRQIYYSLILSAWFKKKFQESIYSNYINKSKLKGIDLTDPKAKEKVYNLYLEAFQKGLYNYIKQEKEPSSNKQIKRRYYSGGIMMTNFGKFLQPEIVTTVPVQPAKLIAGSPMEAEIKVNGGKNADAGLSAGSSLAGPEDPRVRKEIAEIMKILNEITPAQAQKFQEDKIYQGEFFTTLSRRLTQFSQEARNWVSFLLEAEAQKADSLGDQEIQGQVVTFKIQLMDSVNKHMTAESATASEETASWQELEKQIAKKGGLSQRERNVAEPVRVAFNFDSFAEDENISLLGSLPRIIDGIFRQLEGNPNFVPVGIFLGRYAQGMPSSLERLAEFLNSNPISGNAKYKVKIDGENLVLNGVAIPVYVNGLARSIDLVALNADYLIEATRQKHLTIKDEAARKETKRNEEYAQEQRLKDYVQDVPGLQVVVVAAEEDKQLTPAPLVNRVNTHVIDSSDRLINAAEPTTVLTSEVINTVQEAVRSNSPKAQVQLAALRAERTGRQNTGDIAKTPNQPALAIARVLGPEVLGSTEVKEFSGGLVLNTVPVSGANAFEIVLRVDRADSLTAAMLNDAFLKAQKQGRATFLNRPTTSGIETFNPSPVIYQPVEAKDIFLNRPQGGWPYYTITIRGFYSEWAHGKAILDAIVTNEMHGGNIPTPEQKASLETPQGVIPLSKEKIIPQVVPDGKPILIGENAVLGRISVGNFRQLWFNPNFEVIFYNAMREPEITARFLEYDEVSGLAPFTAKVSGDNLVFTDLEDRVTQVTGESILSSETTNGQKTTVFATHYGNLRVKQDKGKIVEMRLHGKEVAGLSVTDNKDGTFSVQGRLDSGTTVKLTYKNQENDYATLVSVAINKQMIVPFGNVRADKNAYKFDGKKDDPKKTEERIEKYHDGFALETLIGTPQLVSEGVQLLETSGQLLEVTKLEPFQSGLNLISAPAKATLPGAVGADATIVPGANTEALLQAWGSLRTLSCASCTTNAAATGMKAVLGKLKIISAFFSTIHAITRTQAGDLGANIDLAKKVFALGMSGASNILFSTTGASTELAKALVELRGLLSGVSLRVGPKNSSYVEFNIQVPRDEMPTVEEINSEAGRMTSIPEHEGGLKGMLGFRQVKSSREVIGSQLGGVFDPSLTKVNKDTNTVTIGIWYDNEGGYINQYITLALMAGLYRRSEDQKTEIVAQNVVATGLNKGATTGRVSVSTAKNNGATAVIVGSGQFRKWQERFDKAKGQSEVNAALLEALKSDVKVPIFNILLKSQDVAEGRAQDYINEQIIEGFRDVPAQDLIKVAVSLELENESVPAEQIAALLKAIRRTIASHITAKYEPVLNELTPKLDNKARARKLGANVAQKVRVALKLNEKQPFNYVADKLLQTSWADFNGLILSSDFSSKDVEQFLRKIDSVINEDLNMQQELRKRYAPRFLFIASLGSAKGELQERLNAFSGVNHYNMQTGIAPVIAQLADVSSLQNAEQAPDWWKRLPPADKVPVRVMLQTATLRNDLEGFVNLYYAVKYLGLHDLLTAHSEQLALTGMTDAEVAQINKAAHQLIKEGKMTGALITAVGEILADYKAGNSAQIVRAQVLARLEGLTSEEAAKTVIAYEPRWAIGTGLTPTNEEIEKMHAVIRSAIREKFGKEAADSVRIIYGGSLNLKNAEEILNLKNVDGALIGGASVDAEELVKIGQIAEKATVAKNSQRVGRPYKKMFIGGNHKSMALKKGYKEMVAKLSVIDRTKVEMSLGPELANLGEMVKVYGKKATDGIVWVDQLTDEEIQGKIFFIRIDGNLPIDDVTAVPGNPDTWKPTSVTRLTGSVPTVDYIRQRGGIAVLVTHFEPKGNNVKDAQSTRFMLPTYEKIFNKGVKIPFVSGVLGRERAVALKAAKSGDLILFENVRLDPEVAKGEKAATQAERNRFAARLYAGAIENNPTAGVVIVNEGFGVMHRDQGSVSGEVKGVPKIGGLLLRKELQNLGEALQASKEPMAVVFGGGPKLDDKVPALQNLNLNTLAGGSKIFIYGGAAIPFSIARDSSFEAGKSRGLANAKNTSDAKRELELADQEGVEIVLPEDFVAAENIPADKNQTVATRNTDSVSDVSPTEGIYDIGVKTRERFRREMFTADGKPRFSKIIVIGPSGMFEYEQFRAGNDAVNKVLAEVTKAGAKTLICGADTATGVEVTGVEDEVTFSSTGGGAALDFLAGNSLPGVVSLVNNAGPLAYHLSPRTEREFNRIRKIVSEYAAATASSPTIDELEKNAVVSGNKQIVGAFIARLTELLQGLRAEVAPFRTIAVQEAPEGVLALKVFAYRNDGTRGPIGYLTLLKGTRVVFGREFPDERLGEIICDLFNKGFFSAGFKEAVFSSDETSAEHLSTLKETYRSAGSPAVAGSPAAEEIKVVRSAIELEEAAIRVLQYMNSMEAAIYLKPFETENNLRRLLFNSSELGFTMKKELAIIAPSFEEFFQIYKIAYGRVPADLIASRVPDRQHPILEHMLGSLKELVAIHQLKLKELESAAAGSPVSPDKLRRKAEAVAKENSGIARKEYAKQFFHQMQNILHQKGALAIERNVAAKKIKVSIYAEDGALAEEHVIPVVPDNDNSLLRVRPAFYQPLMVLVQYVGLPNDDIAFMGRESEEVVVAALLGEAPILGLSKPTRLADLKAISASAKNIQAAKNLLVELSGVFLSRGYTAFGLRKSESKYEVSFFDREGIEKGPFVFVRGQSAPEVVARIGRAELADSIQNVISSGFSQISVTITKGELSRINRNSLAARFFPEDAKILAEAAAAGSPAVAVGREPSQFGPHPMQKGLTSLFERIAWARKAAPEALKIKDIYAFVDQKHGMEPKKSISFGMVLQGPEGQGEIIINQNASVMGGISAGSEEPDTHASTEAAIDFFDRNVRSKLIGLNISRPTEITNKIIELDDQFRKTAKNPERPRFSYIGAEISVGVSMMSTIALAEALNVPQVVVQNYRYNEFAISHGLAKEIRPMTIPVNYGVVWEGGKHGVAKYLHELVKEGIIKDSSRFPARFKDSKRIEKGDKSILLAIVPPQETQIIVFAPLWSQARDIGIKVTQAYQKLLKKYGIKTRYGAESGFTTDQVRTAGGKLITMDLVLDILNEAVDSLSPEERKFVRYAWDLAASEMYIPEIDMYYIGPEAAGNADGLVTNAEFTAYKLRMFEKYKRFISCEDWADEGKPEHWQDAKKIMPFLIQMGDDFIVSRADLVRKYEDVENAGLHKPNQVSEEEAGMDTVATHHSLNNVTIWSHRGTRSAQEVYTALGAIATGSFGGKWTLWGPGRGALIAAMSQMDELFNRGPFKDVKLPYQGALVLNPNGPYKDYGWAKRLRAEIGPVAEVAAALLGETSAASSTIGPGQAKSDFETEAKELFAARATEISVKTIGGSVASFHYEVSIKDAAGNITTIPIIKLSPESFLAGDEYDGKNQYRPFVNAVIALIKLNIWPQKAPGPRITLINNTQVDRFLAQMPQSVPQAARQVAAPRPLDSAGSPTTGFSATPGTTGGIDMQGLDVSASPLSRPAIMPLPLNFAGAQGLTFEIVKMRSINIADIETVLNTAPNRKVIDSRREVARK